MNYSMLRNIAYQSKKTYTMNFFAKLTSAPIFVILFDVLLHEETQVPGHKTRHLTIQTPSPSHTPSKHLYQ